MNLFLVHLHNAPSVGGLLHHSVPSARRLLSRAVPALALLALAFWLPVTTRAQTPATAEDLLEAEIRSEDGEDRISMTVSNAALPDVLRSLAAMRPGVNIVMGEDVNKSVSFTLQDVDWDTALELIVEANGFRLEREGPTLYRVVSAATPLRREIELEILKPEDVDAFTDDQITRLTDRPVELVPLSLDEKRAWLGDRAKDYISSLVVQDRLAIDVIKAFADKVSFNFAFRLEDDGDRQGRDQDESEPLPKISIALRNMRLTDAMQLVASQGGLSCTEQNGVWVVSPMAKAERELEPLRIETFTVRYIPLDNELVTVCQGLVSDRGQVTRGKNKVLVVKDTAEGVDTVRKALEAMDQPTPQVLIEARFFELSSTASRHIGVDWNALGSDGISVTADPLTRSRQVTETETEITTGRLYSESRDQTQDVSTDLATGVISGTNQIVNAVTSQLPGVLQDSSETSVVETRGAILDMAQFGVVLHALKGTAGAKQLSNPKVVVNSDEQATIHIGEQTPIFRSSVDSTGDGAVRTYELDPDFGGEVIEELDLLAEENESGRGGRAGSSSGMRRYTTPKGYLDLGTKLTVAPSVKTDTDIYIRVVPELVSVTGTRALGSGESQVSYPVLFSTRVNTQFTIRSGQTIALGGLVNERTSKTERKVPVLSSLPALGRLFRYESEETSQTETIVFLTVKIVSSEKLSTTSAVPVRSFLGQSEIERIRQEDARGAEYDEETARALLEEAGDPLLSPSERILRKRESESSETPAPEAPDRETVEEADLGVESLPGTEADALSADGEAPATDAPEPQTAVPAGRETSPGEPLGQDGNTGTDTDGTETVVPAQ